MKDFTLHSVRIFAFNWESCVEFYRDKIGLKLLFADPEVGWAHFEVGDAHIGVERCLADDEEAEALVGRFVGASLEVTNVQQTYDELRMHGVQFTSPPAKQPWGGILAHFEDPAGNIVTLVGDEV